MPQPTRKQCFEIFTILLAKNKAAVVQLQGDFVFHVMQAIDGEKDPRNLLLVFNLMHSIVIAMPKDFERFAEECFELISSYFPITFKQKTDITVEDPVTSDDLRKALDNCFAACPSFAPYAVPFFLEKLSSSLVDAKLQTFHVILQCLKGWGSRNLRDHFESIWSAVRSNIMTSKEAIIVEKSLEFVTDFTAAISLEDENISTWDGSGLLKNASGEMQLWLTPLLAYCVNEIRSPDSKMSVQAGRIVQQAARASVIAAKIVVLAVMDPLIKLIELAQGTQKLAAVDLLLQVLQAIATPLKILSLERLVDHPLQNYATKLYDIFLAELLLGGTDATLSINILAFLVSLSLLDPNTQLKPLVINITQKLVTLKAEDTAIQQACINVLQNVCEKYNPALIIEHTQTPLFIALEEQFKEVKASHQLDQKQLETLPIPLSRPSLYIFPLVSLSNNPKSLCRRDANVFEDCTAIYH